MKMLQQPQVFPKLNEIILAREEIKKYLHKMPRHNIEIVFWGSDPWSVYVLKALEDNFDVKAVITAPNSPVANYFKGLILTPAKLDDDFLTSHFSLLTSDLFVVASYGKIIPKELLNIPKYGALNIHPSLLPKYRGPSPVQATILNGDEASGVTIFKMDASVDHGPIVIARGISLTGKEDFLTLINKLFQLGAVLLVKIIPDFITRKINPIRQNHAKASFCQRLTKQSGYFDILSLPSSEKLDRMIRAYYPWPGVWTKWQAKIVKFLPGGLIQMEGKKAIPYKDFLNGYPDFPRLALAI